MTYDIDEVRVTPGVPHEACKDRHGEAPRFFSGTPYLVRDDITGHFGRYANTSRSEPEGE